MSVAACHAVLDVLDDERVLPRTAAAGRALRAAVAAATARFECVGDVRGVGLANAVEIVRDRGSKAPDGAAAGRVKAALRARGVLVGTTGEHENILKIRPPLAFTAAEVPLFVEALVGALEDVEAAATSTSPAPAAASWLQQQKTKKTPLPAGESHDRDYPDGSLEAGAMTAASSSLLAAAEPLVMLGAMARL